uniref:Uncharacterized protein n=1 Tax=Anguilla anguilla TaxID=7936 RepID=A0A0E9S836_ANGAN
MNLFIFLSLYLFTHGKLLIFRKFLFLVRFFSMLSCWNSENENIIR